jgi:hypothetical protein
VLHMENNGNSPFPPDPSSKPYARRRLESSSQPAGESWVASVTRQGFFTTRVDRQDQLCHEGAASTGLAAAAANGVLARFLCA